MENMHITGRLRTDLGRNGQRLRGACLIEVHLHEKSFGGNVKWPFKTGARLIRVAASAGGTVNGFVIKNCVKTDLKQKEDITFPVLL